MERRSTGLVVAIAFVLVGIYACGHDHGPGNVGPEGVVYEGTATDEALVVLLAAPPKPGSAMITITAPSSGQMVPAAAPMTFTWTGGLSAAPPPPSAPRFYASRPSERRWFDAIAGVFAVRPAFAHPNPHNGSGYYLRVISNDKEIVKVFTSTKSYTPDAATWQRLTSAGDELRATLLYAFFEKNNITSDGGPAEAAPVTFRITP